MTRFQTINLITITIFSCQSSRGWTAESVPKPSSVLQQTKSYADEEKAIPKKPTIPTQLIQHRPTDHFHCERIYLYQGREMSCDSNVQFDGEKLRPILKNVPAAIHELNTYQENRHEIKTSAYLSSIGFLIFAAGFLIGNRIGSNPDNVHKGQVIKDLTFFGGGWIAANSFFYSLGLMRSNEDHLVNAVEYYNQSNPNSPIELQIRVSMPLLGL